MIWYDGGKKPAADLFDGEQVSETGVLLIGDKGKLFAPGDYCEKRLQAAGRRHRPGQGRVRSIAGSLHGIRPRDQGRPASPQSNFAELRRPADRDDPAGQPGRVGRRRAGHRRARRSSGMPRT